jgi:hypothetical protein
MYGAPCAACFLLRDLGLGLEIKSRSGQRACAPLYASEDLKQRTLGQEPTGRRPILTSHLVHRSPRKQRTRGLTRSNLAVYWIQTPFLCRLYRTAHPNASAAPGAQKAPEVKDNETFG